MNALKLGFRVCRASGVSMSVFTQMEGKRQDKYEKVIEKENLGAEMEAHVGDRWRIFEKGDFEANMYEVPHNSLVILGAFGHGLIRDMVFGSKMEKIQSVIPNNMLIVGPKYAATT